MGLSENPTAFTRGSVKCNLIKGVDMTGITTPEIIDGTGDDDDMFDALKRGAFDTVFSDCPTCKAEGEVYYNKEESRFQCENCEVSTSK